MRSHSNHAIAAALTLALLPALLAAQAPQLNDAEIAHVAVTANAIDVDMAGLAETRAASDQVSQFARTMITDHTAVNEQAAALATRLGVTPEANAVSASLRASADSARTRLSALRGPAFDTAYMAREVAYHQAVLDALDGLLIPGTANPELRKLLMGVRPAIAAHLEHARQITQALEAGK